MNTTSVLVVTELLVMYEYRNAAVGLLLSRSSPYSIEFESPVIVLDHESLHVRPYMLSRGSYLHTPKSIAVRGRPIGTCRATLFRALHMTASSS